MRKKCFIISILLILVMSSGCVNKIQQDDIKLPQDINSPKDNTAISDFSIPFQLKLNDIRLVGSEDIKIRLVNITEDSRCASDVMCAWQGQVTVVVNLLDNGENIGDFSLTSRAGSYEDLAIKNFNEYSIKLIRVDPYPISTQKIKMDEYVITLVVSKI